MNKNKMTFEIMEFMVWIIEIVSAEFFGGDKTAAYNAMKNSGIWDIYVETYDVTHSLGKEYLMDEMREYFVNKGVNLSC